MSPISHHNRLHHCRGCSETIEHSGLVQHGEHFWHVACFMCTKCRQNIKRDSKVLSLPDGSLLCKTCSKECGSCKLPISAEAVLTADHCYHASCFKCAKCCVEIEDSLFARTSIGILCLDCYAKRQKSQKRGSIWQEAHIIDDLVQSSNENLESTQELVVKEPLTVVSEPEEARDHLNFSASRGRHKHSLSADSKVLQIPNLAPLKEGLPTILPITNSKDLNQLHSYVSLLHIEIDLVRNRLTEAEFECTKTKLLNDQLKDSLASSRDELSKEINKRKAAEISLSRLETQKKLNNASTDQLLSCIADLNVQKIKLESEVAELQERKECLDEMILAKREMRRFMNGPLKTSNSMDTCSTPAFSSIPSGSLRQASNDNLILDRVSAYRRKSSLPALDELRVDTSVMSQKQGLESNRDDHLVSGPDGSFKTRLFSNRRSLDSRPSQGGISAKLKKRISADSISTTSINSILKKRPASIRHSDPLSLPASPTITSASLGLVPVPKSPGTKKVSWKNAFKLNSKSGFGEKRISKVMISSPVYLQQSSDLSLQQSLSLPSDAEYQLPKLLSSKKLFPVELGMHKLVLHPYIRPVKCDFCREKLWGFQTKMFRCSGCGFQCHTKCASSIVYDCPGVGKVYPKPNPLIGSRRASLGISSPIISAFGSELENDTAIPGVVQICVQYIEDNGLAVEGIYRIPGSQSTMKMIRQHLNTMPATAVPWDSSILDDFKDVTAVASVLKQYFRELPNPLLTYDVYDAWLTASHLADDSERVLSYSQIIRELPYGHKQTLMFMLDHLYKVHQHHATNLMTSHNLGVVFGPTLLRCQNDYQDLEDTPTKNATLHQLIASWPRIRSQLADSTEEGPVQA